MAQSEQNKKRRASKSPSPTSKPLEKKAKMVPQESAAEGIFCAPHVTNPAPAPVPAIQLAPLNMDFGGLPHFQGFTERDLTYMGIFTYKNGATLEGIINGIQVPSGLLPNLQLPGIAQSPPGPGLMGINELYERGLLPRHLDPQNNAAPALLSSLSLSNPPIQTDDHAFRTFREVVWNRYFEVFKPDDAIFDSVWLNWVKFLGLFKGSQTLYSRAKTMDMEPELAGAVESKWKDESSAKRRIVEYLANRQIYGDEREVPSREHPDNLYRVPAPSLEEILLRYFKPTAYNSTEEEFAQREQFLESIGVVSMAREATMMGDFMVTETGFNALHPLLRLDIEFKAKVVAKDANPPDLSWGEYSAVFRVYHPECFVLAEEYQAKYRQWLRKLGLDHFPFNYCHGYEEELLVVETAWNEIHAEERRVLAALASAYKEDHIFQGSRKQQWYFLEAFYGFADEVSTFDPTDTSHRGRASVDPDYNVKKGLWLKHIGLGNEDGGYLSPDEVVRRWRSKSDAERDAIEDKAREEREVYCAWQRESMNLEAGPIGRKPVTILASWEHMEVDEA